MASRLGNGRAHVLEISNRASVQKLNLEDVAGITASLDNHYSGLNTNAHQVSNIAGLQDELNGKSDIGHTHNISEITGLEDELDAKADVFTGYTGTISVVTSVNFVDEEVTTADIVIENGVIISVG